MTFAPHALAPLAEREREYTPSSCIAGDWRPFAEAYRTRSVAARERSTALGATWQRIAYGPSPAHGIELCLPAPGFPAAPRCPLLVFIHGGYWQELSAADSLFAAAPCIDAGIGFAAIDYTLAPAASVDDIVAECRRAMRWLHENGRELGIATERVVVAGSSAGAHLAAMVALPELAAGVPTLRPRAAVLVSGVYWLEPLVGTTINAALGLDALRARAVSPGYAALPGFPRALVAWGEVETTAFKGQSRLFAEALRAVNTPCEELEVPARNHFDVILDLADPATALGRRTLALFAAH